MDSNFSKRDALRAFIVVSKCKEIYCAHLLQSFLDTGEINPSMGLCAVYQVFSAQYHYVLGMPSSEGYWRLVPLWCKSFASENFKTFECAGYWWPIEDWLSRVLFLDYLAHRYAVWAGVE